MATDSFHAAASEGPCFICRLQDAAFQKPWYDEPVDVRPGVGIALLGVGAMVPGYLLACPVIHVTSLAQIPSEHVESFCDFVDLVRHRLDRRFGPTLMFEHAGCQSDDPNSAACVAHAHLHVWSLGDRVKLTLPLGEERFPGLRSFLAERERYIHKPYLLAENGDGIVRVGRANGAAQYFRRQVAEQLNRPDEWDYAAFPFEEAMRRTLEGITS